MKKKLLILIVILVTLFFITGFSWARELELTYPNIPNAITPVSTRAILPEMIIYLFGLAVRISGLIVFGTLLYGGYQYITSTGDPNKQSDATDQIRDSFLGLGIILLSFILLQTINPQLINLGIAKQITSQGIVIFKDIAACEEFKNDTTKYDKLANEDRALKLTSSVSNLRHFLGDNYEDKIQAVYFFEDGEDLETYPYTEENWVGKVPLVQNQQADSCLYYVFAAAKSIKFIPKPPGVYLCCGKTYDANWSCQFGEEKHLAASTAVLPPECNDNVGGIKIKPHSEYLTTYPGAPSETELNRWIDACYKKGGWDIETKISAEGTEFYCLYQFAIVLHNNSNFGAECEVFLKSVQDLSGSNVIKTKSSSATVFRPMHSKSWMLSDPISPGEGITLYIDPSYTSPEDGPGPFGPYKEEKFPDSTQMTDDKGLAFPGELEAGQGSIKISPEKRYIAILFEGENYTKRCQVFIEDTPTFIHEDIGRTQCEQLWIGCHPNIQSLQIYPTR